MSSDLGDRLSAEAALELASDSDLPELLEASEGLTLKGHGPTVTFCRNVFIPLTHLCRDVCHYCAFAKAPRPPASPYLTTEQAITIARAGAMAGCTEALFTLGDQPELRYAAARDALASMGFDSTLAYVEHVAGAVHRETGLMPHLNPGVMDDAWIERLRRVSVSMGLMLETASERLSERGGPHFGSRDKHPQPRLATIAAAGRAEVPFTTGILIGIGETRRERIEALLAIRDLHDAYGHIQEVIVQNFRAKPGTRMAQAPEPSLEEHLWTIAAARLILGPAMSIQAPPNLQPGALGQLLRAGANDWGGVSPVTADHVNPEAPWPALLRLQEETESAGRRLAERLPVTPPFVLQSGRWVDETMRPTLLRASDSLGRARDREWTAGSAAPITLRTRGRILGSNGSVSSHIRVSLDHAAYGQSLGEPEISALFSCEGPDVYAVIRAADNLRRRVVGDAVTHVVNRNINYTNICLHHCGFCAFSKGGGARDSRGPAYRLDLREISKRAEEAWARGATEVCLQGGIHPAYDGETYLSIVNAVTSATPDMHVHAFSPLEVIHGARTLGLSLEDYLGRLKRAGLSSLPGTAAEILDEEVRAVICADKLNTEEWLAVMRAAHRVGLRSTATVMFGHVDEPKHWARHLLHIRTLQEETEGFTEFVPLPFVHMEAPMWRKGLARSGPTLREAVLMHAVARLTLHPTISSIQTSWVKMGPEGAALCLEAGANDLGGTLMNESITRAAGGANGQEMSSEALESIAGSIGRPLRQRTTFYDEVKTREHPPQVLASSLHEKARLFSGTAAEVYGIDL